MLSPKERYVQSLSERERVTMADVVNSREFDDAAETALLQLSWVNHKVTSLAPHDRMQRLDGAWDFLQLLKSIATPDAPPTPRPPIGHLNPI